MFAAVEPDADSAGLATASDRLRVVVLDVTSARLDRRGASPRSSGQLAGRGLDGLVNNAGVGFPGPLELLALDDLRRQLEVNVIGQVAMTQAMLPLVREASGRIVFVGSVGGILASQFAGAYHASKFAIEAIGDVWRQELEPEGIDGDPHRAERDLDADLVQGDRRPRRAAAVERAADGPLPRAAGAFRESLHSADEHGKPPEDVAEVIAQALTARGPTHGTSSAAAGRLATALRPLIPDRVADKLAQRTAQP